MYDLCGTWKIRTHWCLSQFNQHLRHRNSEGFILAKGTFHGVDMPFNETVVLRVVPAYHGMFEAIVICEGLPFLGLTGLSIFHEDDC